MNLNDHVAVVTGASGGLGTWVTRALLDAGAKVIGIARKMSSTPGEFSGINADLNSSESAIAAINQAHSVHGRINSLIHLVGAFAGGAGLEFDAPSTFDAMFDANVRSAFYVARAVIPLMRAAGHGRLVLTASRAAIEPSPGVALYGASKAALVALTRSIAAENGKHGITANVVLPGTMDTPTNRSAMPNADYSKWVKPSQVAELMAFLVSPAADSINGAAIPVFGSE